VNHLKVALIQERTESSDASDKTIYDVELVYHQNFPALTITYLKVMLQTAPKWI